MTEPGSSSDRVILIVDLEEKSTGDFSVSGGYSTTDGALAEVSISERNLLGRGLYAKASVTYGQYARGYRCRSSSLICWTIASRSASTFSSASSWPTAIFPTAPRHWASARGSDLACVKISPCSCVIRSTSRRSRCRASWRIVTTIPERVARLQPSPAFVNSNGVTPADRSHQADKPPSIASAWPVVLLRRRSFAAGPQGAAERQDVDLGARLFAELQHAGQQQEPDRRPAGRLSGRTSPASAVTSAT